jgi:hypothetical protein
MGGKTAAGKEGRILFLDAVPPEFGSPFSPAAGVCAEGCPVVGRIEGAPGPAREGEAFGFFLCEAKM